MKRPAITIIGCGYLGATHAAGLAHLGFEVLGVDQDVDRVAQLAEGRAPFYDPGLEPMLRKKTESGRLRFTSSYEEAARFGDVHFLCVDTPQRPGGYAADVSQLEAAVDRLAPQLSRRCLVVGKSTVPVGTAAGIAQRLAERAPAGDGVALAWSPEFLREGHALDDTLRPDRLVFGVTDPPSERMLRQIYAAQIDAGTPTIVCDLPTAELVKAAANAFLATKISFINAMADLCEATGADVRTLADAIGHDPRIGRRFLDAGLGFGGGCLPKDIRAFMARAGELGVEDALTFLFEIDSINQLRRQHVVELAVDLVDTDLCDARLAVLGAAFKPDSDDVRDSPALDVAARLHERGAHVTVHDPKAMPAARRLYPMLAYAESVSEACLDADLVLVLTEWTEYRRLDPLLLSDLVARRVILDARNCLDRAAWRGADWTYRGIGRP